MVLLLDALDVMLSWQWPPPTGARCLLCEMAACLVGAPAAGHVRYKAAACLAQLTFWRQGSPMLEAPRVVREGEAQDRDWWTTGRCRRTLLKVLDQRYLAELPMNLDPREPTLLVIGRGHPFTDAESDEIAAARRSLLVVERLIDRLDPPRASQAAPHLPETPDLTPREHQVLQMLGEGLLARSIAQRLTVSERTVHKHLGNVYRKLDAHDRLLAVRRAEVYGLLAPPASRVAERVSSRLEGW
jgi:DNA-binding CsgD family transcriptional regulator